MTLESQEQIEKAKCVIEDLLRLMDTDAAIDVAEPQDDHLYFHITTADPGRLIGRNAQTLDSLQFIVNRIMVVQEPDVPRCTLDVERYRERHRDKLIQKANEAADRVERTGRAYRFDPMPSYDRRTVHRILEERDGITTHSLRAERGHWKQLVIEPVAREEAPGEPEEPAENNE